MIAADEAVASGKAHQPSALGAGGEHVLVPAVYQAAQGFPYIAGVNFLGNGVLDGAEPVKPAVFLFFRGGILHFGGGSAGTGGENKGEQTVVVHLLDEGNGFLEFLLGFSGEAHDYVGGQHQIGHDGLGVIYFPQIGFPVIVPVHGLEHPTRSGLEGQVQLLGNLRIFCHGVEELFGSVSRMARHEANEKIAGKLGNGSQKVGKVLPIRQILAVGVHILTQQGNFLGTVFNETPALGQNVLKFPAPLPTPDIGYDAVGAEIVAAVHNGHPGLQPGIPNLGNALGNGAGLVGNEKLPLLPAEHVPQNFRELPQMVGGEHPVHQGEALPHPVGDLGFACHAAAQEDFLSRVTAFGVGQSSQIAEDPLLRVLPDGAGVQNDHVRTLGLLADGVAALGKIPPQLFGVCLVLLAAVGLYIGFGGHAFFLPISGDFITAGELTVQLRLGNHGGFGIHKKLLLRITSQS